MRLATVPAWILTAGMALASGCGTGIHSRPRADASTVAPAATGTPSTAGTPGSSPVVTITHPPRGACLTQRDITITGRAQDTTGPLVRFEVNGRLANLDASGAFAVPMTLEPGLNIITTRAVGSTGRVTIHDVSVLYGAYLPDTQPVKDAMTLRVNDTLLAATERPLEQLLTGWITGQNLSSINPVFRDSVTVLGACMASAEVDLTGIHVKATDVDLDAIPGGLSLIVTLQGVTVFANARSYCGLGLNTNGTITADNVIGASTVTAYVDPRGQFVTNTTATRFSFQNVRLDVNGFPNFLLNPAVHAIQRAIENVLHDLVSKSLPDLLNDQINKYTAPQQINLMGRNVDFRARPTSIRFDATGGVVMADASLSVPRAVGIPNTPGSLYTPSAAPVYSGASGLAVSISDDVLNRGFYEGWKGGFFDVRVDQAALHSNSANVPFRLEASMLQQFLPSLAGRVSPTDPVVIHFRSLLPPTARIGVGPDLIQVGVGEGILELYVESAGQQLLVLKVGVHLKLAASVSVIGNQVRLTFGPNPTIRANVLEEPIEDVDDLAVEALAGILITPTVPLLSNYIQGLGLPSFAGLTVVNPRVFPDGPNRDFLTIVADVR